MGAQVVLISGASSGFGALTAQALAKDGHFVYAGFLANESAENRRFAQEHKSDLRQIQLDVTSDDSIQKAVTTIMKEPEVRLDVIVHNAGHMVFGPAEAFTPEQYMHLYEINCVGCQRVNRIALPHMRKAGKGLLVWISSSSANGPSSPFLAPYFAAKAAQDYLAQTYAVELVKWGIETTIVVPGIFTQGTNHFTDAGHPADEKVAKEYSEGPYNGADEQCLKGSNDMCPPDADPGEFARPIANVVNAPYGKKPFRVHVEPANDGSEAANAVAEQVREQYLRRMGFEDLIRVSVA